METLKRIRGLRKRQLTRIYNIITKAEDERKADILSWKLKLESLEEICKDFKNIQSQIESEVDADNLDKEANERKIFTDLCTDLKVKFLRLIQDSTSIESITLMNSPPK